MKGDGLWWVYMGTCRGVVGGDETGGAAERFGGAGYGLEPKDTATSIGRRPVFANPSQAL
jgi:hypothetical protein